MIRTLRMFACMLLALCACNAAGDRPTEHKLGSTIYGPGPVSAMTPVTLTGTIHIDPQNSSGHASHVCSGAVGCPFLSYSDVVLVWGRRDPYLSATTILFFDSSHTDNTDPIVWEPILGQGAFAYIEGAAPTVVTASVSLASTTAKNTAAGTNALLSTNLGATAAVDQLVENTTHSSRAWVYKLVSGTTFSMSQPFAKVDITSASLPAEVDTWANTDTVKLLQPIAVNIVSFSPIVADFPGGTAGAPSAALYQLRILDPAGADTDQVVIGPHVTMAEVVSDREIRYPSGGGLGSSDLEVGNIEFPAAINVDNKSALVGDGPVQWFGGIVTRAVGNIACGGNNTGFDGDAIFGGFGFTFHSGTHLFGKVYLDCNITVRGNSLLVSNYAYGTRVVYGSGTNIINAIGSSHVQLSAGTFTTAFTAPGLVTGMKLNSSTTGCSHSGAATDVINCGITLTPAHLDAAQGTAGCGSNCYFPGGAGVSNFN